MASLITHQLFAKDIYEKLKGEYQRKVSLPHLEVFAQSHDLLYYYHNYNINKTKEINKLGNYAHKSNTQSYIINIIRHIKKNKLENNPESIAYLYGAICHFILDANIHPFVFYKTGCYFKNQKETKKYAGLHNEMERHIDAFFYELKIGKKIKKVKIAKEIVPKIKINKETINLIENSYKNTYNKDNISYYFKKGTNHIRNYSRIISQDHFGIKKLILSLISIIIHKTPKKLNSYSYNISKINNNYLNLEYKVWHHPCTNEKNIYSVLDIYNISIAKTLNIIEEVNKVLYENNNYKDLINIIPNISYTTGLPINKNKPLIFFEF